MSSCSASAPVLSPASGRGPSAQGRVGSPLAAWLSLAALSSWVSLACSLQWGSLSHSPSI